MKINHLRYFSFRRGVAFFTLLFYVGSQPAWTAPEILFDRPLGEVKTSENSPAIPPELGTLMETFGENPSLFIIPDAHGQYEAQKSTDGLLEFLKANRGLNSLFIEGGAGRLDPSRLTFFDNGALNLEIAGTLMREAEIGGAERFTLRNREFVTAYGTEDLPLYLENFQLYQEISSQKDRISAGLEKKFSEISKEASRVFSKELFEFFRIWSGFEDEKIPLPVYLSELEGQAQKILQLDLGNARAQLEWPMLVRFFELKRRQPLINAKKAETQKEKLSAWAAKNKMEKILPLQKENGGIPETSGLRESWERFYSQASSKGFRFEEYPDFFVFEGFQILSGEIEARVLMEEMEKLREQVLQKLASESRAQALLEKFRQWLKLRKILSLSVTSAEYRLWNQDSRTGLETVLPADLREVYGKASRFYDLANQRDETMGREILSLLAGDKKPAAVIAGGFHTEGLCRQFRERKISYAVIMPHLSQIEDSRKYGDAMNGKNRKLDFGASAVRVPQWMMDDEAWPSALQTARAEIRRQITDYGISKGASPARAELRSAHKDGSAEHLLPDYGGKMLPLSINVKNRYRLYSPPPALNSEAYYENDPLESDPGVLPEEGGRKAQPERMIEHALAYLETAVQESHKSTLEWLRKNVFILAMQLPTVLFYEDDRPDDLFEKTLQVSYRRNAILFSMEFLKMLNPDSKIDQALVGLYLMRAADLMLAYHSEVESMTYENENRGLLPEIFGEIYEDLQKRKTSYHWRTHLRMAGDDLYAGGAGLPAPRAASSLADASSILKRIAFVRNAEKTNKASKRASVEARRDELMYETSRIIRIYDEKNWQDLGPQKAEYQGKDISEIPHGELDDMLYGDSGENPGLINLASKQADEKMRLLKYPELETLREMAQATDQEWAIYQGLGITGYESREAFNLRLAEAEKKPVFMPDIRAEISGYINELSEIAFFYQSSGDKFQADRIYDRVLLLLKALQKVDGVGFFPMQVQQQILYLHLRRGNIQEFEKEFGRFLDTTYAGFAFRNSQRTTQGIYRTPAGIKAGWGGILFWMDGALPDICLKLQVIAAAYPAKSAEAAKIIEIESEIKDVWWQILKANRFNTDLRSTRQERMTRPMVVAAKEKEADTSTAVSAGGQIRKVEEPYRIFYGFSWKQRPVPADIPAGQKPPEIAFRVTAFRRTADGGRNPAGFIDILMKRNKDNTYSAQIDPEGEKWAGPFPWVSEIPGLESGSPGMVVHISDLELVEGIGKALMQLAQTLIEASGGGTRIDVSRAILRQRTPTGFQYRHPKQGFIEWPAGTLQKSRVQLWKRHSGFLGVIVHTRSAKYRLESMLDKEGNGRVYRAVPVSVDPARFPSIAVKVFSDQGRRRRALRESQIKHEVQALRAAGKDNEYVPMFYGSKIGFSQDSFSLIAMEFLEGESLKKWAEENASLPQKLSMSVNVVRAASMMHRNKVVHLDLKPSNLFVTAAGKVKILDFTYSQIGRKPAPSERNTDVRGTPAYMAPEMFFNGTGPYTPATDVYLLGASIFEVLTGQRLFALTPEQEREGQYAKLGQERKKPLPQADLEDRLPLEKELKEKVGKILRKALDPDPKKRFQDAGELLEVLSAELPPDVFSPPVRSEVRATTPAPAYLGKKIELKRFGSKVYTLTRFLDSGAGGEVYLASASGQPDIAVKIIPSHLLNDPEFLRSLVSHEVKVMQAASASNLYVPEFYGAGLDSGNGYSAIAMEYIQGETLAAWAEGKPDAEKIRVALKTARAVASLHMLNEPVVHLDIKPWNFLVTPAGKVKILDFMTSQIGTKTMPVKASWKITGTPAYMAPEIFTRGSGPYEPSTDVYMLAEVLFELASGQKLFQAGNPVDYIAEHNRQVTEEELASRLPETWHSFIPALRKALDVAPEKRYRNAEEFLTVLEQAASEELRPKALNDPSLFVGKKLTVNGTQYSVDSLAGAGGYAWVFKAHKDDGGSSNPVAVKIYRYVNREAASKNEYRALIEYARKDKEHVPAVIGWGHIDGPEDPMPSIVMEFLEGQDLAAWVKGKDAPQVLEQALSVLEAAASLHPEIVHQDLKPANIYITDTGVKILDFGVARFGSRIGKPLSRVKGTYLFAAPEALQGSGVLTPRIDVYSLGVILYWMALHKPPFSSPSDGDFNSLLYLEKLKIEKNQSPGTAEIRRALSDLSTEALDVWGPAAKVIARAINPDPSARYADAEEMFRSFRAAISRSESRVQVMLAGRVYESKAGGESFGGGLSGVYRGRDTVSGRETALKVYDTYSGISFEAQEEEFNLMKQAHEASPEFVPDVLGVGRVTQRDDEINGDTALVMDFAEGQPLNSWREGKSFVDLKKAAEDILAAHSAIYRAGVLHGDIKPQNIIMTSQNKPAVIDFGLALPAGQNRKNKGFTDQFAAPEAPAGTLEPQTEVYSLGLLLFWLAAGNRLFKTLSPKVLRAEKLSRNFTPSEIIQRLREENAEKEWEKFAPVIAKAVRANPAERYANPAELFEAWRAMARSEIRTAEENWVPINWDKPIVNFLLKHQDNPVFPRIRKKKGGKYERLYAEGENLERWAYTAKSLSDEEFEKQIVEWTLRIGKAVELMEAEGLEHGDLQPRNVIITKENQPVLIDFSDEYTSDREAISGFISASLLARAVSSMSSPTGLLDAMDIFRVVNERFSNLNELGKQRFSTVREWDSALQKYYEERWVKKRSELRSIDSEETERWRLMAEPKAAALTAEGYQALPIYSRALTGPYFSVISDAYRLEQQVLGQEWLIGARVIHELIFNMLEYAFGGAVGFKVIEQEGGPVVEITAWDNGYGLGDPEVVRQRSQRKWYGGNGFRKLSTVGNFVEIVTGEGIWRRNADGEFEQAASLMTFVPGTRITVRIPFERTTVSPRSESRAGSAEKKIEAPPVTEERAREFSKALEGIYEILNRPEFRGFLHMAPSFIYGLPQNNYAFKKNPELQKEIQKWYAEISGRFPDIVPFMRSFRMYGDLLFNENNEAVLLFGESESGKGSLGYAFSRVSNGRVKIASADDINLIRIPGHLLAGSAYSFENLRARAYDSENNIPYQSYLGVGLVRAEFRLSGGPFKMPIRNPGESHLKQYMAGIFPGYEGTALEPWTVTMVNESMVDPGDFEKYARVHLSEIETQKRSELRTDVRFGGRDFEAGGVIGGDGGIGTVHKVTEKSDPSKTAALKIYTNSGGYYREMAELERKAMELYAAPFNGRENPFAVKVYPSQADDTVPVPFIGMEYIDGKTLLDWLYLNPVTEEKLIEIVRNILKAVHEAHLRGIVHRDLKPANFMVTGNGSLKLIDFNLSQVQGRILSLYPGMAADEVIRGTLDYLAPEMTRGVWVVNPRADVFVLGLVLYQLATGHQLIEDVRVADIPRFYESFPNQVQIEAAISKDKLKKLSEIIAGALKENPDDRLYKDAGEMLSAFEKIYPPARAELRAKADVISAGRADAFFREAGEIYEILSRPEFTQYRGYVHSILNGLYDGNPGSIENGALKEAVTGWMDKIRKEYPEIVAQLKMEIVHSDILFNQKGDAVILSGVSRSGKSSLAYAFTKVSGGRLKFSADDEVIVLWIPGYLYAGPAGRVEGLRARAYGGEDARFPVDPVFQLGPVRTVIEQHSDENFWVRNHFYAYVKQTIKSFDPQRLELPIREIRQVHKWTEPAEFERFAGDILPVIMGEQSSGEVPSARSESRAAALEVAAKTTAKILGLDVMRELYGVMFPESKTEIFIQGEDRSELASGYSKLFKAGASAVLPAKLLLNIPEDARSQYLDLLEEGFQQSGSPAGKAVYFAGRGAEELARWVKGRPASKVFEIIQQDEVLAAGRRSKDAISVSVTSAPENIKDLYHLPSFLIDPAVLEKMDPASSFKYMNQLTQLQLLAAVQLKRDLGDVVHVKEYTQRMAEFLGKVGIEYISRAGLVTPTAQSLLSETLGRYLRAQELTGASA